MSIGMGYAAAGLSRGLEDKRQRERQIQQDDMTQQRHDVQMQGAQQRMDQSAELHPMQMEQAGLGIKQGNQQFDFNEQNHENAQTMFQQQQEEAQMRNAWMQAMAQAEIKNDPTALFDRAMEMGIIEHPPEQVEGGWLVGDDVLGKEDLMGFGASLLQPGKLTEMRQARMAAQQQALQAQQERMDNLSRNVKTAADGTMGVVSGDPTTGQFGLLPIMGGDGQPVRAGGADGGPKTADFNSATSWIRVLMGFHDDGFVTDPEKAGQASDAGKIAATAIERHGLNPVEAAYIGYQSVKGPMSEGDAVEAAEGEARERGLSSGFLGGNREYADFVENRSREIMHESRMALQRAQQLGLLDDDVAARRARGGGQQQGQDLSDDELLKMYGGL